MAQTNSQNKGKEGLPWSEDVIRDVIRQQTQKLEIEKANIQLEEKRIASQEKLAMKAIDYQARDNKASPGQMRMTLITISSIIFVFLTALISVILYLVSIGKDDFAYNILKALTYVVTAAISYYAGKRSKKSDKRAIEVPEAEVVD